MPISSYRMAASSLTMKPNLDADEAPVKARGLTKTCLRLFINHPPPPAPPPLLLPPQPGAFTSEWTFWQKAICQWLICIQAISGVKSQRLTSPSAYSPGVWGVRCGQTGSMWEGRSSCSIQQRRLWGGSSSLTPQDYSRLLFLRLGDAPAVPGVFISAYVCNWPSGPTGEAPCGTSAPCFSLATPAPRPPLFSVSSQRALEASACSELQHLDHVVPLIAQNTGTFLCCQCFPVTR